MQLFFYVECSVKSPPDDTLRCPEKLSPSSRTVSFTKLQHHRSLKHGGTITTCSFCILPNSPAAKKRARQSPNDTQYALQLQHLMTGRIFFYVLLEHRHYSNTFEKQCLEILARNSFGQPIFLNKTRLGGLARGNSNQNENISIIT